jgi:cell division protein FtsN
MRTDRGTGGRSAFFGLAMLILGALLFASGVMVGRQMALDESTEKKEPLFKIDQRDKESKKTAGGGNLVYPEVLDKKKPEPEPVPAPVPEPKPEARPAQKLTLQVAAYGDRSQADGLLKKLVGQGYENPHIAEREVPGKGTYYRVRVGPFTSREEASRVKERLEKEIRVKVLTVLEGQ